MKSGNQVVGDRVIPTDKIDDALEVDNIVSRHVCLASLHSFLIKTL